MQTTPVKYLLPPCRLYRHLSPMLRGLGLAICLQAALRWAGTGQMSLLWEKMTLEVCVCYTLRSCTHDILIPIWIFSPYLEDNDTLECSSKNFHNDHISGLTDICLNYISMYCFSPRDSRTTIHINIILTIFQKHWNIWSLWKNVGNPFHCIIVIQSVGEKS